VCRVQEGRYIAKCERVGSFGDLGRARFDPFILSLRFVSSAILHPSSFCSFSSLRSMVASDSYSCTLRFDLPSVFLSILDDVLDVDFSLSDFYLCDESASSVSSQNVPRGPQVLAARFVEKRDFEPGDVAPRDVYFDSSFLDHLSLFVLGFFGLVRLSL
jgi:hypothetical protein